MYFNWSIILFIIMALLVLSYVIYFYIAPRKTEPQRYEAAGTAEAPTHPAIIRVIQQEQQQKRPSLTTTITLSRRQSSSYLITSSSGYQSIVFPATYNIQNNYALPLTQPISAAQSISAVSGIQMQRQFCREPPAYKLIMADYSARREQAQQLGLIRGIQRPRFSF